MPEIPPPEIQLPPEEFREALDVLAARSPIAQYIPKFLSDNGTIVLYDELAAQPYVLAHEVLHHVLYRLEGPVACTRLDHLPLHRDPIEHLDIPTQPLTRQAVQETQEDALHA